MRTGVGVLRRCVVDGCPTDLQNGREGMLTHLQVVHHPGRSLDELALKYAEQLAERGLA